MKNILQTAILLGCSLTAFSQTPVPNGDFENWFPYDECNGTDSLVGYITFDQLIFDVTGTCPSPPIAVKSTDKYSGTYALELNPHFDGSDYYLSSVYSSSHYEQIPTGVPFSDTPSKLTGYVKFNQTGNDILTILVEILDKDNNYKGWGYFIQKSSLADYTKFEIPITYDPQYTGAATALIVAFSVGEQQTSTSENTKAHEGTKMVVDNLSFEYGTTTATTNYTSASPIHVFAAQKNIQFSEQVSEVNVIDMIGAQKISQSNATQTINAAALNSGLYIVTYKYKDAYFSKKVVIE
jgi:hypothetical protein